MSFPLLGSLSDIYICKVLVIKQKKETRLGFLLRYFAEREGFEPPVPLSTVVFKTTVIDHSTISPVLRFS